MIIVSFDFSFLLCLQSNTPLSAMNDSTLVLEKDSEEYGIVPREIYSRYDAISNTPSNASTYEYHEDIQARLALTGIVSACFLTIFLNALFMPFGKFFGGHYWLIWVFNRHLIADDGTLRQ
jgi:hypothetical protein